MVDLLPVRPGTGSTTGSTTGLATGAAEPTRWSRLRSSRVGSSRATAPLALGVFALIFTGLLAWIPSPWYDEAATISAATRTVPQLMEMLKHVDIVHGLYYLLMHAWFSIVGYSPFTLRFPSTVATALAAGLLVVLVRRMASRRTALIAGIAFVLLPRVTWMATEGRSYAISAMLAVALTLLFHVAWGWSGRDRVHRTLIWAAYGALAALAGGTFIYLALLVAAHGVTAVILAATRVGSPSATTRFPARSVSGWVISSALAGLVLTPLALASARQSGQVDWIKPLSAQTFADVFQSQWFLGSTGFAAVAWVLICIGILVLIQRVRGRRLAARAVGRLGVLAAVVLPWMLLPTIALLVESLAFAPLFSARYVTFAAPAAAVVIALGIMALPRLLTARVAPARRRWIPAAALIVLLAVTLPTWVTQRSPEGKQQSSWGEVAARLEAERAAEPPGRSDAVIYGPLRKHPDADMAMLALAYPEEFSGLVDLKLDQTGAENGTLWETRIPLAASRDRLEGAPVIWLVTSDLRDWRPTVAARLANWGYRTDTQWSFTGINLVRYVRN